ncbi:LLM class flavin-dependent oxidoreductase [Amnibacterium flavum]|uniref:FAD-linked oxidase n=1 Tax=Amnibacterium flavum TaxID=2173173 RepID=A0A2V1HXG4_9MICO|nr:LLM class flavin-dependent oxidoreductase [Amnibacterium flavum]PVZ95980.1 FAD-linked oxidase [Amnibacterium flavum]
MPDYGHVLQFGTFVTPTNRPAESPVLLAQLSERLGFDLVTFQDHPYQPGFLDTWTLLSWVGAQTERIHISGNVINLPLRPPAVLARAAASLDLLTDGRFDLGLGAGGFWDPIAAMGGRRLTPGQAVDALSEAIDVLRGTWDGDRRDRFVVDGDYYAIDGAKRGPRPRHDIPIWLGAAKPRMLRLVGTKADGWLPSFAWLPVADMPAANARIDDAAAEAGREPREIRRLLNIGGAFTDRPGRPFEGPAKKWVDDLLPLVLEHGFSTFILAGDDPTAMQRFAEEVAPALRTAVDRERGKRGTTSGPSRSALALSRRTTGIDYDGLPESLRARAVEPGDFDYGDVRNTYLRGGAPGLVLRPRDASEVVEALAFAREQGVALAIRSGGHGISGRSTNSGGIVIDVGALNSIEVVDAESRLVRLGAGARWMNVARALGEHGWALSSGDYGGVGVGGLATAGGIGWLVREHGLTIDHLRSVEVVLADGRIVHASEEENADLFWAMRGAGANFGIAISFEFEVDEVGEVGWAQLVFDASDTAEFLTAWGAAVEAAPRDLTSFVIVSGASRGGGPVAHVMSMVDSSDPDTIIDRLQPFAQAAPLLQQSVQLTDYAAVMANATEGPHAGRGEPIFHSALLRHITPEFAAAATRFLASGATSFFQIRSVGGAVSDVDADATAYAHRSAGFSLAVVGSNSTVMDAAWAQLREHFDGLYLSFETGLGDHLVADAFPPSTLARLRSLKGKYDPSNVFTDNFNIAPAVGEG